ncbi:hypothetical protein HanRHA438_Chr13g0579551 [Helianthus annuus]|nr:hypothetical protein HanIR_Chr13g0618811 [Helianthus annuus]KAJ0856537.1 hypothetical protein HanRHA438_Chr13g0579551 [Helianthus annuus]
MAPRNFSNRPQGAYPLLLLSLPILGFLLRSSNKVISANEVVRKWVMLNQLIKRSTWKILASPSVLDLSSGISILTMEIWNNGCMGKLDRSAR